MLARAFHKRLQVEPVNEKRKVSHDDREGVAVQQVHSPLAGRQLKVPVFTDGRIGANSGDGQFGIIVMMVLMRAGPNLFGG